MVVKGTLKGHTIILDEPLALPPDSRLVLTIEPDESPQPGRPAQSLLEWAESGAIDDPSLPADLSRQHDHYLYRTPKQSAT